MPDRPKQPDEIVEEPLKSVQVPDRYGEFGSWQPNDRYLFGSAAEIDGRRPEAKYDLAVPQDHAPRFTPIRAGGSGSTNDPVFKAYGTGRDAHKFRRGRPLPGA